MPTACAPLQLRAVQLMGQWRRAIAAHQVLAGSVGCACGSAFDGIAAADLERDLVAYVCEQHGADASAQAVFAAAGATAEHPCDLATLLRALADAGATRPEPLAALMDDLERAVHGMAQSTR